MKMIKIGIPQYEDNLCSLEQALLWFFGLSQDFKFTQYLTEKVIILKYTQVFVLFVQNSM